MRIVQVLHNFPPEFDGGVERAVASLSVGLRELGHEVQLVVGSEQHSARAHVLRTEHLGFPVHRLVRGATFRSGVDPFEPELAERYEEVLRTVEPDVVHIHHWWNLGDDLVRRAERLGIPTVLTFHDHFATCAKFFRLPSGMEPCRLRASSAACGPCAAPGLGVPESEVARRIPARSAAFRSEARTARARLAPSESHARWIREYLEEPDLPVEVVGLGVTNQLRAPATPPWVPPEPLRLLHFGNLGRIKGVEVLARAVESADPSGQRIRLLMAGGVVESDLDLGRAELLGAYDHERLETIAETAHLAVFPSLAIESYGLVVDEALRLGLPVIVGDRGALDERIGSRGVIVPSGSVEGLADVLRAILADPGILAALQGGEAAPLPSIESMALAHVAIYERARGGEAPPPCDLERPILERLTHFQERLFDILAPGGVRAKAPENPMNPRFGDVKTRPGIDPRGDLVSVITRTRNRVGLLAEAVASVAAQTHRNVEMIVVNDGGEDPEPALAPFRDQLKIIKLEPGRVGRCLAANLALNAASGTWIAWLDDDDLFYPHHLEVALEELRRGQFRVVYTDAHRIDQVREHEGGPWREVGRSVPYSQDFSRLMLFRQAYIHLVTVVHHRACVESLGGFDESLEVLEDWDLFFRFAQDYEFRHLPVVTSAFRIRNDASNAVTALRKEFAETRTRLFSRYIHVAFPELLATVQAGHEKIVELEQRLADLESRKP